MSYLVRFFRIIFKLCVVCVYQCLDHLELHFYSNKCS